MAQKMKYIDKYGDIWVKISKTHVKREKDGIIGGWYNGDGLSNYRT